METKLKCKNEMEVMVYCQDSDCEYHMAEIAKIKPKVNAIDKQKLASWLMMDPCSSSDRALIAKIKSGDFDL